MAELEENQKKDLRLEKQEELEDELTQLLRADEDGEEDVSEIIEALTEQMKPESLAWLIQHMTNDLVSRVRPEEKD
jgi:hypothetical protein